MLKLQLLFLLFLCVPSESFGFDLGHSSWTELLGKYTDKIGHRTYVQYGKWKEGGEKELNIYLSELSALEASVYNKWSSKDQLAFLLNAYNAFTIKLILNNYPLDSIKDIGNWFQGPWKKRFFSLLGEKRHLDNVEHNLIRGNYKEPRIHFAVNCASIGCPELQREAFVGSKLDSQLAKAEKDFFLDQSKIQISKDFAKVSKILDWYGSDFFELYESVSNYIVTMSLNYGLIKTKPENLKIIFLDYDWSLNGK